MCKHRKVVDMIMFDNRPVNSEMSGPDHCEKSAICTEYEMWLEGYATRAVTIMDDRNVSTDTLFRRLQQLWKGHKIMTDKLCNQFFQQLDTLIQNYKCNLPTIRQLTNSVFRKTVFAKCECTVIPALLDCIARERQGEYVNQHELKNTVEVYIVCTSNHMEQTSDSFYMNKKVFIQLDRNQKDSPLEYYQILEKAILRQAAEYYQNERTKWLTHNNADEYLRMV